MPLNAFLVFRHITANMLKTVLPLPAKKDDENVLVMVCGPPGFMKLLSGEKTKDYKQVLHIYIKKTLDVNVFLF